MRPNAAAYSQQRSSKVSIEQLSSASVLESDLRQSLEHSSDHTSVKSCNQTTTIIHPNKLEQRAQSTVTATFLQYYCSKTVKRLAECGVPKLRAMTRGHKFFYRRPSSTTYTYRRDGSAVTHTRIHTCTH